MRSARTPVLALILAPLVALSSACGGELSDEPASVSEEGNERTTTAVSSSDTSSSGPTLYFTSAWQQWASASLIAGGKVSIDYDAARLPHCRATHNGNPGWQVTSYLLFLPGGTSASAGIYNYAQTATGPNYNSWVKQLPQFNVPQGTSEVQVWFQNSSGFDQPCSEWDSNFGQNYHFAVQASSQTSSTASLSFNKDWTVKQTGTFKRGAKLSVSYDAVRMTAIATGLSSGTSFFASKYHCYGYGCCSYQYHNRLWVRTDKTGSFTSYTLSGATPVTLSLPSTATTLEIYFDTKVYTTTWYCGGSTGAKTTVGPDSFYDSNLGKNFVYAVQ